jgi:hypothetical protein
MEEAVSDIVRLDARLANAAFATFFENREQAALIKQH